MTISAALLDRARAEPRAVAWRLRSRGRWYECTWHEAATAAARIGIALTRAGVTPGNRIAILSRNLPAWIQIDVASQGIGAAVLALPTDGADALLRTQLEGASVHTLFVEDCRLAATAIRVRDSLPALEQVVVIGPASDGVPRGCVSLSDVVAIAGEEPLLAFAERVAQLDAESPAVISLTSGTTGPPKAAVFSHRAAVAVANSLSEAAQLSRRDELLSCLPLSHITERMLAFAAITSSGHVTNFGRPGDVRSDLRSVEPTFLLSTPRLWRQLELEIDTALDSAGCAARSCQIAVEGETAANATQGVASRAVGAILRRYYVYRLRRHLGLCRLRRAWTVSAPLPSDLARYFEALGVVISEVYGTTEQGGFALVSPGGAAAKPMPSVELRLAASREIMTRGPATLSGYIAGTAPFDAEGWLRTGDLGELDEQGRPCLLGRGSDAIVTATGAVLHPSELERRLLACNYIRDAVLVAGARGITALVVAEPETCARWASDRDVVIASREEALVHPAVRDLIQGRIDRLNDGLGPDEQIARLVLLPKPLARGAGEVAHLRQPRRQVLATLSDPGPEDSR
jgi:long-chain acyl-CoA synthetase